ncbi:serine hydrolase domain-containing protein [Allosalinactinospora lopnorensis]|uniref:serine hydrolase domain-containing protein n=1 Tax=Allosalinactinospora lopnorensis TaxID=1352348 RepID=UPI000623F46B|nr:serine hydrolase domain-containing protein [Allosalinactinospora lopnorensis]
MIEGDVRPGFEEVREEFERNFAERGEVGAAFSVYRGEEPLVDLWGGYRDPDRGLPWESDTLLPMFSATKGVAAGTMAVAHAHGAFDYDTPVAEYWPEFAQNGKGHISVRDLLDHRAGLSALDVPVGAATLADPAALAGILAAQQPRWKPGTRHGYHSLTLGLYQSELMRRVDSLGRGVDGYFQQEIAHRLGLEFYIGTPDSVSLDRQAALPAPTRADILRNINEVPFGYALSLFNPMSITRRTFGNPPLRTASELALPPYRGIELASANGIGQVRDVARFYAELAGGGAALGLDDRTFGELKRPDPPPSGGERDLVLKVTTRFTLGFWKPFADWRFGSDESAFGAPGAGGSFGFADPARGTGYCYGTNALGLRIWDDRREKALRDALYRCL